MKNHSLRSLSLPSVLAGVTALFLACQAMTGLAQDTEMPKELSPEAAEAVKKAIEEAEARAKGLDPEKARKRAEKEAKAKAEQEARAAKEAKKKAEKEARARAKLEKEQKEAEAKEKSKTTSTQPTLKKKDPKARQTGPRFDRSRSAGAGSNFSAGRITTGVLLGEVVKGSIDMLIPMHDNKGGMLFLDPRFSADDEEEQQLAVGLGWRQNLAGRDIIVGGNIFYDSVWTEGDAQFNQVGFGLELLTALIDARFNYYLPEDDFDDDTSSTPRSPSPASSGNASESNFSNTVFPGGARLAGATVFPGGSMVGGTGGSSTSVSGSGSGLGAEPSFEGFDAEIGLKLPLDQIPETRIFAGIQVFDNALGGDDFEGFVGRVEVRPTPGVTVDLQYLTEDDLNKEANWFAGVRINLPFSLNELAKGRNPFAGSSSVFQGRNTSFDSRMYEYVVRNPQ